jgi:hypothetical protein
MSIALVVEILGDASKLGGELDKVKGKAGGFGDMLGANAGKLALIGGAASVAAVAIAEMTMAAAADRDEANKLATAVEAAGAATATSNAQIEEAIALGQEKAFTDSQTREALTSLVTATGDVTAATDLLATAQDVARFAGVDLATAADAVAKANAGQDGALRKLIPGLEKGATATDTIANAQKAAAGQADAFAASSAGQMAKAQDSFGELAETLGSVFLPILDTLLPLLVEILKPVGKLVTALLPAFKAIIGAIAIPLRIVIGVISKLVDLLANLVTWMMNAIEAAGKFLDSINPLKGISLPDLPFLSSSTASAGPQASTRAGSTTSSSRAPVINVYTTGDGIEAEQAIVRALRRTTRINGGVVPALGWVR